MAFTRSFKKQSGGGGGSGDGQVVRGTFTSPSTQYGKIEIDCGFQPDLVVVLMAFTGNTSQHLTGQTLATCIKKSDGNYFSSWDLRPMENTSLTLALGQATGETGISDITSTGFKYRVNASNTQGKACEYTAVKFSD